MTHRLRALRRPAVAGRPRRPVRWWHRLLPPLAPAPPSAAASAGRSAPADRVGRWPRLLLALGLAVAVTGPAGVSGLAFVTEASAASRALETDPGVRTLTTEAGALTTDAGAAGRTLATDAGAAGATLTTDASATGTTLTTDAGATDTTLTTDAGATGTTVTTDANAASRTPDAAIGAAGSGPCPTGPDAPPAGCAPGALAGAPGRVTAGRWGWPLAGRPPVLRRFDPPASPYGPGHRGVDLGGAPGDLVLAAGPGTVVYAGVLAGRGVVSVQHPSGLRTTYEPLAVAVEQGETVSRGTVLGRLLAGHSGCPWPACLHWGLRRGETYLDPLSLIRRGPVRLLPRHSRDPGG